jgi:putative permease
MVNVNSKYQITVKLLLIAACIVVLLWLASQMIPILFLFFFAIVFTLILNAPATWLVSKGWRRSWAALFVFTIVLIFIVGLAWLVIPVILDQLNAIIANLPEYYQNLKLKISTLLEDYPSVKAKFLDNSTDESLPSMQRVLRTLGKFSITLIGGTFLFALFFSLVVYMLIDPKPLIETYLFFFAERHRDKAAKALAHASNMLVGWMWSNFVVGLIESVFVFFFLRMMNVPGVWVWAGLALFAEMLPKLGMWIMAIPPTLIALSIDPLTAVWVFLFYVVLNEAMSYLVTPRVRASAMNLHPVSTIFVMVAMAAAFGFWGALVAVPLTAFIKSYYEAFFLSRQSFDNIEKQVEVVIKRKV